MFIDVFYSIFKNQLQVLSICRITSHFIIPRMFIENSYKQNSINLYTHIHSTYSSTLLLHELCVLINSVILM